MDAMKGSQFIPGWSRGRLAIVWFIPLLNLWKPYEVLRELLHYSSPQTRDAVPESGSFSSALPYLLLLWIPFLLVAKLPRIWLRFYGADDFPPGTTEYAVIAWARYLPLALDSVFFIYVISAIDKLQNARHAMLRMQARK